MQIQKTEHKKEITNLRRCIFRKVKQFKFFSANKLNTLAESSTPFEFDICHKICSFLFRNISSKRLEFDQKTYKCSFPGFLQSGTVKTVRIVSGSWTYLNQMMLAVMMVTTMTIMMMMMLVMMMVAVVVIMIRVA